jgi:hypothetical protein
MSKGVAYTQSLQPYAVTLQSLGFDFVVRYYSNTDPAGNLTAAEVQALNAAGLAVVPCWNNGQASNTAYFTFENGRADGTSALSCAKAAGQPSGTPIYFAVLYDAAQPDIEGAITNYFLGAQMALLSAGIPVYTTGIYGSGLVCSLLPQALGGEENYMFTWMADAANWNNNQFTGYNLRQYQWQLAYPPEQLSFDIHFAPNSDPGSFVSI